MSLDPPHKAVTALALTAPVAMGYIPLGTVFGFLFVQAGGTWWLAICASLLVYAGAAQYMMIPLLAAGMSVGSIALATLIINSRHIFYGLSLLSRMPARRWQRWYLIFALTDETYSLVTTLPAGTKDQQMVSIAMLNQLWWVLGTTLGAVIGAQAQITLAGLDFALVALFCVLTIEQWRSRQSSAPVWVALVAFVIAYPLSARHALVISIGLSLLAAVFLQLRSQRASGVVSDE